MKKIVLALTLFFPIISNAHPQWKLINVFMPSENQEKIGKLYLDINSLDKSKDIRTSNFKVVIPKEKDLYFSLTIMCSLGLYLSDYYTLNIKEQRMTTEKSWKEIFSRDSIVFGSVTYEYLAYKQVCKDRLIHDVNNVKIDTRDVGLK